MEDNEIQGIQAASRAIACGVCQSKALPIQRFGSLQIFQFDTLRDQQNTLDTQAAHSFCSLLASDKPNLQLVILILTCLKMF